MRVRETLVNCHILGTSLTWIKDLSVYPAFPKIY